MDVTTLTGARWLGVLVAAVLAFVLGTVWYGPLFGRFRTGAGAPPLSVERVAGMGRVFGVAFLLALAQAVLLGQVPGVERGLREGVTIGLAIGIGWVATAAGIIHLFDDRPPAHFLIHAGYAVVSFALMGAVLGAWP